MGRNGDAAGEYLCSKNVFGWRKDGYLENGLMVREVGSTNYSPISVVPEFAL